MFRLTDGEELGRWAPDGALLGPALDQPPVPEYLYVYDPTDIVGVDSAGQSWYLDRRTARIVAVDVGDHRRIVTSLGRAGKVRTACAIGARAVAFLDEDEPSVVLVRLLDESGTVQRLLIPPALQHAAASVGAERRLDGSSDGPCVLWARGTPHVLVITDSIVGRSIPIASAALASSDGSTALMVSSTSGVDTTMRPLPSDVTSFPGGMAILGPDSLGRDARLVDLYDDDGRYLESMALPRTALHIAGSRHRLLVLSVDAEHTYVESFLWPARIRRGAAEAEEAVVAPPAPFGAGAVPEPDTIPER